MHVELFKWGQHIPVHLQVPIAYFLDTYSISNKKTRHSKAPVEPKYVPAEQAAHAEAPAKRSAAVRIPSPTTNNARKNHIHLQTILLLS